MAERRESVISYLIEYTDESGYSRTTHRTGNVLPMVDVIMSKKDRVDQIARAFHMMFDKKKIISIAEVVYDEEKGGQAKYYVD